MRTGIKVEDGNDEAGKFHLLFKNGKDEDKHEIYQKWIHH